MELYRYRSIKNALKEINDGTFYFAGREELNDPIEGYVKLYFQGDQAAWEGLLRNYVCSLFVCIQSYLTSPKMDLKELTPYTVVVDLHRFNNIPLGEILENLGTTFLNDDAVQKLVGEYGNSNIKCTSKELQLILRLVHCTAFNICLHHFKSRGILSDSQEMLAMRSFPFPFEIIHMVNEKERAIAANVAENQIADMMEKLIFSAKLRQEGEPAEESGSHKQYPTWATIQVDFPKLYVAQLKNLIYPEGYIVCFSATATDSAMWGNYAQEHSGICFIYETQNINDKKYISSEVGNLEVKHITYSTTVIERNFFITLGGLNYPQVQSWLTGKNGLQSELLNHFSKENQVLWREQYWRNYIEKFHRKNPAWSHE